jgi:hypothetical protein
MIAIDLWSLLGLVTLSLGIVSLTTAIVNERRMQRHRQPGVSYADVTLRRDGGWKRAELFTDEGLRFQRRAAKWGFYGMVFIVLTAILWTVGASQRA